MTESTTKPSVWARIKTALNLRNVLYAIAMTIASMIIGLIVSAVAAIGGAVGGTAGAFIALFVFTTGFNYVVHFTETGEKAVIKLVVEAKYRIDQFVVWYYTRGEDKPANDETPAAAAA